MSGYSDMYKDQQRREWINKWVPLDEELPELELEQYRFTLARARSAEAEVETYKRGLRTFQDLIGRAAR